MVTEFARSRARSRATMSGPGSGKLSLRGCGLSKSIDGATCPSLHHRKEGQPSDEEMLRSHKREAGWFSDSRAKGKPPRMRERMLRCARLSLTHLVS